jgi:hypothetical protein
MQQGKLSFTIPDSTVKLLRQVAARKLGIPDSTVESFKQLAALNEQLREHVRESGERLSAKISASWAKVAENMRRFYAGYPEQIRILAQNGWFTSLRRTDHAAIYPIAHLFRTGNFAEGHKQMCAHFSRIRQDIEDDLTKRFPERQRILQKAFQAHDAGDYELSVPVFLAQADGIPKEILGVSIYTRKRDSVSRMGDVIENIAGDVFEESLLRLVLEPLPLTASTTSPTYRPGELNRHEVLHGIDNQYATELNSYRAISWLQRAALFDVAKKRSDRRSKKVG